MTGTIDAIFHSAQVCENTSCTVTTTSGVNFGYFTTASSSNVTITDTELTGYIWGKSFGWVVLNCVNTISGCSVTNGNFKVSNTSGQLSGYAWGENSGWINFGPFSNSATSAVSINSSGEFNGYAWMENYGWVKFDCTDSNYCVKTDWRPSTPVITPTISTTTSGGYSQCSDKKDNDNDGFIDYPNDPGCDSLMDMSEVNIFSFCYLNPNDPSCNPPKDPAPVSYCQNYPKDPYCSGVYTKDPSPNNGVIQPTFCSLYPTDKSCINLDDFCRAYPSDLACSTSSYCGIHLDDPDCSIPTFCSLNPNNKNCADTNFCTLRPTHSSCTKQPEKYCTLHPNDPGCRASFGTIVSSCKGVDCVIPFIKTNLNKFSVLTNIPTYILVILIIILIALLIIRYIYKKLERGG